MEIKRIIIKCDACGKQIKRLSSQIKRNKHHFCNCECKNIWQSERMSGKNNPAYKQEPIKRICKQCGKTFYTPAWWSISKFCSTKCYGKWMSENRIGENHPNYGKLDEDAWVETICTNCGKKIKIRKTRDEQTEHNFCNQDCYFEWFQGENTYWYGKTGEQNINWQGGLTKEYELARHNKQYKLWRNSVFERDNFTCQKCEDYGSRLEAHHIKGFAKHKDLRYAIDNGITFCEKCHKEFHKLYGIKNIDDEDLNDFLSESEIQLLYERTKGVYQ